MVSTTVGAGMNKLAVGKVRHVFYNAHVDKWELTVHDDCLASLRDGGAVSLCWDGVVGKSLVV